MLWLPEIRSVKWWVFERIRSSQAINTLGGITSASFVTGVDTETAMSGEAIRTIPGRYPAATTSLKSLNKVIVERQNDTSSLEGAHRRRYSVCILLSHPSCVDPEAASESRCSPLLESSSSPLGMSPPLRYPCVWKRLSPPMVSLLLTELRICDRISLTVTGPIAATPSAISAMRGGASALPSGM